MPVVMGLLGRFWPHLLIVAAVLGGVWYLDHRGYQRAKQEEALADARQAAQTSELRRQIEAELNEAVNRIAGRLSDRLSEIDVQNRTIVQPIIEREIRNDPRLSDPAAGIPDSVRDALNAARRGPDSTASR